MLPRVKILLLLGLPCLLLSLNAEAQAQSGRLAGTVVYYHRGQVVPAAGARVLARGAYEAYETRTNGYGNFVMVLRAGAYDIRAYGAYGYSQRQQVVGYVGAGTDSVIAPNPLVLARDGAESMTSLRLSPTGTSGEADGMAAPPINSPAVASANGRLRGTVMFMCDGVLKPRLGIRLIFSGPDPTEARTNENGTFNLELQEGVWKVSAKVPNYAQDREAVGIVTPGRDSVINPNTIIMRPTKVGVRCPPSL